jgi:hypothetical protein
MKPVPLHESRLRSLTQQDMGEKAKASGAVHILPWLDFGHLRAGIIHNGVNVEIGGELLRNSPVKRSAAA